MSKRDIQRIDLSQSISQFIEDARLDDIRMSLDTKTGTATVSGRRDGMQYTTTIQSNLHGTTRTSSAYSVNVGKDALIEQAKQLRRQGYKQTQIAAMLGVSQATISKYLRM